MRTFGFIGAIGLAAFSAIPVSAACWHNGELYAKTTLEQEFRESKWVVRATVIGQRRGGEEDDELPWVSYDLMITSSFKGEAPTKMVFYTERNSGAFYLEPAYDESAVDEDYLLFLIPNAYDPNGPEESKGSVFVNYSCGLSKPWGEVSAEEKAQLEKL